MRKKLYDEFVRDCGSSCMDEYIAWLEDRVFALETKVEKFTSTNNARDEICPHYYKDRVDLTGEGTNFEVMSCCRVMGKLSPVA